MIRDPYGRSQLSGAKCEQGDFNPGIPERGCQFGNGAGGTIQLAKSRLVVVRAAEVVAAVGADQLAAMADEAVGAGGADLAVVLNGQLIGYLAVRTTL